MNAEKKAGRRKNSSGWSKHMRGDARAANKTIRRLNAAACATFAVRCFDCSAVIGHTDCEVTATSMTICDTCQESDS